MKKKNIAALACHPNFVTSFIRGYLESSLLEHDNFVKAFDHSKLQNFSSLPKIDIISSRFFLTWRRKAKAHPIKGKRIQARNCAKTNASSTRSVSFTRGNSPHWLDCVEDEEENKKKSNQCIPDKIVNSHSCHKITPRCLGEIGKIQIIPAYFPDEPDRPPPAFAFGATTIKAPTGINKYTQF